MASVRIELVRRPPGADTCHVCGKRHDQAYRLDLTSSGDEGFIQRHYFCKVCFRKLCKAAAKAKRQAVAQAWDQEKGDEATK